jgi:asparagine synthase (glutamine-hydrolysing)
MVPTAMTGEPYFSARVVGDRVEIKGIRSCRLGHRLPSATGARPDGVFAGWSWDESRLDVYTDRYGFYPLYYFAGDRHVGVSTSLHTLLGLGAPRDLDEAALAVFLRLGCFVGDDTPFAAIRTVPPDADFTWRPGSLKVTGRLALGKAHGLNRDEAIDACIALFRRSMAKRESRDATVAVPLSGGQDSRHIVLELAESGRTPTAAITMRYAPPTRSEDLEAGAVAARLGIPHVILDPAETMFEATQRAIARQNLCSAEHAWILPLVDYVRGQFGVVYDGIGGDVLSAGLFLDREGLALFESGRLATLAEQLVGLPVVLPLPRGSLGRRLDSVVAQERLRRELERHADAPNPLGSFVFWNRTRRSIAQSGYRLMHDVPLVFSPYLDHELYDLLAGLPASMLVDHEFHADAIRRAYPSAANVPYAPKPEPTSRGSTALTKFSRQMLAYAIKRASSGTVRHAYLWPRLMRCLVDREYAGSAEWLWRGALYLWALQDAIERPHAVQEGAGQQPALWWCCRGDEGCHRCSEI